MLQGRPPGLIRNVVFMSIRQMLVLICCHGLESMVRVGDRQDQSFYESLTGDEPCLRRQELTSLRGMQEALLPGQALHRRVSSLDNSMAAGDPAGLLPHTALRRCLDAWAPLLIDECDFAAAFLLLYKPIDEAQTPAQGPFGSREGAHSCHALAVTALSVFVSGFRIFQSAAAHAELFTSGALQFSPPLMCLTPS